MLFKGIVDITCCPETSTYEVVMTSQVSFKFGAYANLLPSERKEALNRGQLKPWCQCGHKVSHPGRATA